LHKVRNQFMKNNGKVSHRTRKGKVLVQSLKIIILLYK